MTEMQKLKNALEDRGIEWTENNSDPEEPWQYERIRFKTGKDKWSVIAGECSIGGKSGLLELWNLKKSSQPRGFLTARDVLERIGIIKAGQLGIEL